MVSVPLWREKNDAIESEAIRKHQSANAEIEDVTQKYQSRIFDLLDQVRTAERTIVLYRDNILPQSRQTLESDQQSYAESKVEFDRVIQDLRNVLELEIGYHRSVTALAISLARLEQATGSVLVPIEE
jgi:outer membrane protein TolC